MKTLALALLLTVASDAFGQQVVIVQPRQQSNSAWNPANPRREWLGYNGRSGREREAGTVQQLVVTQVRVFPNLQPTGRAVIVLNPFVR